MNLVVGATGVLGGEICRVLIDQGRPVRALRRASSPPDRVERLESLGAETVLGDLKYRDSLAKACEGVDAVFSTATVIIRAAEGDSFERTDHRGHVDLIEAAEKTRISRFVFVSFGKIPVEFPMQDAKRAVERRLAESPITHTILRPGNFVETWLSPTMGWDVAGGRVRIPGDGEGRLNWTSVEDVARVAVAALDDERATNATIEFGAEHTSWNDMRRQAEEATGRELEAEHIPVEALQAQYESASDPHARTFAALWLAGAFGDPRDRSAELRRWIERPTLFRDTLARPSGRITV
jgi:uncharacterized protein YbjT (DUF2867 family)